MNALRVASMGSLLGCVLVAAAACDAGAGSDVCGDLKRELSKCGLPATDLECARLDVSAQEDLVQRVETMGCDGAAYSPTSSAVDPRICELGRFPCPSSPTPEPGTKNPVHPVVFVSGIDGSAAFDWSPRIIAALAARGVDAEHVKLASWATTETRGAELWDAIGSILRRRHATKVSLIGYAVGGLDCRWVASDPTRAAALASVTTIATPHRGTRVADAALAALKSGATADVVASLVGAAAPGSLPDDGALARTLEGLTAETLSRANPTDAPAPSGVWVQSFAGVSHVLGRASGATEKKVAELCVDAEGRPAFFRHPDSADVLNEVLLTTAPFAGAPADGMVSVESSKWGVFRGCIPADHYDVIGQIARTTADPITGFDAARFYEWLVSDLAERGF